MEARATKGTLTVNKPTIFVRESDYGRLTALAQASVNKDMAVGDELMAELERATVVADGAAAQRTIQMGSTATYQTGTNDLGLLHLCIRAKPISKKTAFRS